MSCSHIPSQRTPFEPCIQPGSWAQGKQSECTSWRTERSWAHRSALGQHAAPYSLRAWGQRQSKLPPPCAVAKGRLVGLQGERGERGNENQGKERAMALDAGELSGTSGGVLILVDRCFLLQQVQTQVATPTSFRRLRHGRGETVHVVATVTVITEKQLVIIL